MIPLTLFLSRTRPSKSSFRMPRTTIGPSHPVRRIFDSSSALHVCARLGCVIRVNAGVATLVVLFELRLSPYLPISAVRSGFYHIPIYFLPAIVYQRFTIRYPNIPLRLLFPFSLCPPSYVKSPTAFYGSSLLAGFYSFLLVFF